MDLQAWWASLDVLPRVLYCIAVPASVVLGIQMILALIGFGHGSPDAPGGHDFSIHNGDAAGHDFSLHHADALHGASGDPSAGHDFANGHDADAAHGGGIDALKLFTLSGVVSFFTVFSWSSIVLLKAGLGGAVAVVLALIPGSAALYLAAKLIQLTSRLSESGTMELSGAVGLIATVYIPIPGGGEGKVMMTLQGQFAELSAVTDGEEAIPSGTQVRVTGVRGDALVVEMLATRH